MEQVRMVPFAEPRSAFEAKVLTARLGAEGILWELRGGVDGVYPVGAIEVRVAEGDLERARELLLLDDVEAAFDEDAPRSAAGGWVLSALVVLVVVFALARILVASS